MIPIKMLPKLFSPEFWQPKHSGLGVARLGQRRHGACTHTCRLRTENGALRHAGTPPLLSCC